MTFSTKRDCCCSRLYIAVSGQDVSYGYLQELAALDCLSDLLMLLYLASTPGCFSDIGFSSFTVFSLYQRLFFFWRFFPLSALAMHPKLTVLAAHPNLLWLLYYTFGNAGICTITTHAVSLITVAIAQLPDYPMEGQVLCCA